MGTSWFKRTLTCSFWRLQWWNRKTYLLPLRHFNLLLNIHFPKAFTVSLPHAFMNRARRLSPVFWDLLFHLKKQKLHWIPCHISEEELMFAAFVRCFNKRFPCYCNPNTRGARCPPLPSPTPRSEQKTRHKYRRVELQWCYLLLEYKNSYNYNKWNEIRCDPD